MAGEQPRRDLAEIAAGSVRATAVLLGEKLADGLPPADGSASGSGREGTAEGPEDAEAVHRKP